MDALPFRIEKNAVESNWLGVPVGTLHLSDPTWRPDGAAIATAAAQEGHRLVILATAEPVSIGGFVDLGTLAEYEAPARIVRERLPASRHFEAVPLGRQHWPLLHALLDHAAPTRFTRDARIGTELAKQRKLEILRTRLESSQGHGVLAFSASHVCSGFQYSFVEDGAYVLYELAVAAAFSRGVVAAEMIASNVTAATERGLAFNRVSTLVYSDNQPAIGFFGHLGLQPTGRRLCHYHLWV